MTSYERYTLDMNAYLKHTHPQSTHEGVPKADALSLALPSAAGSLQKLSDGILLSILSHITLQLSKTRYLMTHGFLFVLKSCASCSNHRAQIPCSSLSIAYFPTENLGRRHMCCEPGSSEAVCPDCKLDMPHG